MNSRVRNESVRDLPVSSGGLGPGAGSISAKKSCRSREYGDGGTGTNGGTSGRGFRDSSHRHCDMRSDGKGGDSNMNRTSDERVSRLGNG